MCLQCGQCYREHPYSMDDAIDAYESLGLKVEAVASQYGRELLRLPGGEPGLSRSHG
jgi:molybdenum cofactor biosynthesis enzyme MoaA